MVDTLRHAFIDESGGVSLFVPKEPFLVVASLVTQTPRNLELLVKRTLKRFGSPTGEIKATHSSEKAIRSILESLAQEEVAIVILALDKRGIVKPPKDPESLYRHMAALSVRECVERWQHLEVTLDKRYTHRYLRQKLEWQIRNEIAEMPEQAVVIRQEDSRAVKSLQVADMVAWAAGKKYLGGNERFFEIIKSRVVVERTIVAE